MLLFFGLLYITDLDLHQEPASLPAAVCVSGYASFNSYLIINNLIIYSLNIAPFNIKMIKGALH